MLGDCINYHVVICPLSHSSCLGHVQARTPSSKDVRSPKSLFSRRRIPIFTCAKSTATHVASKTLPPAQYKNKKYQQPGAVTSFRSISVAPLMRGSVRTHHSTAPGPVPAALQLSCICWQVYLQGSSPGVLVLRMHHRIRSLCEQQPWRAPGFLNQQLASSFRTRLLCTQHELAATKYPAVQPSQLLCLVSSRQLYCPGSSSAAEY